MMRAHPLEDQSVSKISYLLKIITSLKNVKKHHFTQSIHDRAFAVIGMVVDQLLLVTQAGPWTSTVEV